MQNHTERVSPQEVCGWQNAVCGGFFTLQIADMADSHWIKITDVVHD